MSTRKGRQSAGRAPFAIWPRSQAQTPDEMRPIIDAFRAPGVSFLTPYAPAPLNEKTVDRHQPRGAHPLLAPDRVAQGRLAEAGNSTTAWPGARCLWRPQLTRKIQIASCPRPRPRIDRGSLRSAAKPGAIGMAGVAAGGQATRGEPGGRDASTALELGGGDRASGADHRRGSRLDIQLHGMERGRGSDASS